MIPREVSYSITRDEEEYKALTKKRMVDVQLNMKVSPEVLREIALEVKGGEKRQYERTFISVRLPEIVPGAKNLPWATCHFNPALDVKILGLTIGDEDSLTQRPLIHPGKLVGAWIIDTQFIGHLIAIYEDGGKLKQATIAPGGERFDAEMVELPAENGNRRFQAVGSDEIQEVDPAGTLRMINRNGEVFAAARRLR